MFGVPARVRLRRALWTAVPVTAGAPACPVIRGVTLDIPGQFSFESVWKNSTARQRSQDVSGLRVVVVAFNICTLYEGRTRTGRNTAETRTRSVTIGRAPAPDVLMWTKGVPHRRAAATRRPNRRLLVDVPRPSRRIPARWRRCGPPCRNAAFSGEGRRCTRGIYEDRFAM